MSSGSGGLVRSQAEAAPDSMLLHTARPGKASPAGGSPKGGEGPQQVRGAFGRYRIPGILRRVPPGPNFLPRIRPTIYPQYGIVNASGGFVGPGAVAMLCTLCRAWFHF
jgi:hypothetical protein